MSAAPLSTQLRQSAKSRLIGQPLQRLDGPGKSGGSLRFAGDVRLPNMLFASARMVPPDGRLSGFEREKIEEVPGVRHIAARDFRRSSFARRAAAAVRRRARQRVGSAMVQSWRL